MLDYDTALIDCQKINDPENTDVILIVKNGIVTVGTQKEHNINTESNYVIIQKENFCLTEHKTVLLFYRFSYLISSKITLSETSHISTHTSTITLSIP